MIPRNYPDEDFDECLNGNTYYFARDGYSLPIPRYLQEDWLPELEESEDE